MLGRNRNYGKLRMPTLFRMIIVIAVLGGGAAAGLAVLGLVAKPDQTEMRIDVTSRLPGR
ncbi:MAG: histidine kinase [Hyphomicrobiales bacterium]|nr:MAG: histidine kinase [Hyphomicrobiales bacterium]